MLQHHLGSCLGNRARRSLSYTLIIAIVLLISYPQITRAAASITAISDTMSRLQISQASSHVIKFTTGAAIDGTSDTIVITFPADFNFTSKTISSVTFTHGATTGAENTETLAASPSASAWGAVFSGTQDRILTLTTPSDGIGTADLVAGDKVIITYDSTNSINGSTAATYLPTIQITGANPVGATQFAVTLLTSDQVTVAATIDPYLTFNLTTNSVTLTKSGSGNPNFQSGGTGYNQDTANTLAAATNGASGYTITYYGDTLKSGSNSIAAMATKTTSSYGTPQFGINLASNTTPTTGAAVSGSGTGVAASDYGTANNFRYVTNTATPLASATAGTASNTFTVSYIVNVGATTPAGAYSTTITYICTGNF